MNWGNSIAFNEEKTDAESLMKHDQCLEKNYSMRNQSHHNLFIILWLRMQKEVWVIILTHNPAKNQFSK